MKGVLVFLFIVISLSLYAVNINVPGDYSTIQAAIDGASDGDVIIVENGTYYENVNFNGKSITLTSQYMFTHDRVDIINTIIDGSQPSSQDEGSCVSFKTQEKNEAVLNGFTIMGGTGTKTYNEDDQNYFRTGGGILINKSSPTIMNNIIRDNACIASSGVAGAGGGGIRMGFGKPIIINNIIRNNKGGYAGGIMIAFCSGATIHNNVVADNTASWSFNGGGGIYVDWRPVTMTNMTIINNHSGDKGGGIISTGTVTTLINCIVYGNTASNGGEDNSNQIMKRYGGNARISYSCIENNFNGSGDNEGVITEDPLVGSDFYLMENSPCIDTGNDDEKYNDVEDPKKIGYALRPSFGTIRNDMGAFGGSSVEELFLNSKDINKIEGIEFSYANPYLNEGVIISSSRNVKVDMFVYSLSGQLLKVEKNLELSMGTINVDIDIPVPSFVVFKDLRGNRSIIKIIKF